MPTYVYRRADGTIFEIEQRITEPALTTDPETGLTVQRVISGAGLVFKGSGFYLTDYSRKGEAATEAKKEGGSEPAAAKTDATVGPTEAKTAEPAKPAAEPADASPAPAKKAD